MDAYTDLVKYCVVMGRALEVGVREDCAFMAILTRTVTYMQKKSCVQ